MFVGRETRIRDRFAHRREFDESRDLYYNSQNSLRINRSSKEDIKKWPRKYEERVYQVADDHQKYRPRTPIDEHGYRSYEHPQHRYPEHHHYRSRSRSPPPVWPPHHRRDYSAERKQDRRKDEENKLNVPPVLRNKPVKSLERRSNYSSTRYSIDRQKEKTHLASKAKCSASHNSKNWKPRSSKSRSRVTPRKSPSVQRKQNTFGSKEPPRRSPTKKKSLSRVSSSDFKSSPSTEHLEKQKKYLVDRLAEYEKMRQGSQENVPESKPKSPQMGDDAERENNRFTPVRSPIRPPASPTSSSLHSFDCKGEGIHYNINFPNQAEDEDDYLEETHKTFEPLGRPEFVTVPRLPDFKPFFVREEFKRNKDDVLKEDKILLRDFRKNGLKRDSADNIKFHVDQDVLDAVKNQALSDSEPPGEQAADARGFCQTPVNPSNRTPSRRAPNNQSVVGDGYDLRQRICERLQKRQVHGGDSTKPFLPNQDTPSKPETAYDHHKERLVIKPPIRRVVNNNRSTSFVRTFSNGSTQPKRSVVITRSIPTNRFIH